MARPLLWVAAGAGTTLLLGVPLLPAPLPFERTESTFTSDVATTGRPLSRGARSAERRPATPFGGYGTNRAERWARARHGRVAFAVIDSSGRLRGHRAGAIFPSASLVKAMLLVAYLRRLDASDADLDPGMEAVLAAMIRRSDNRSADAVYGLVGDGGLQQLARKAGMRRFSGGGYWANTGVSAADQARFFLRLDRLTPPPHRRLTRRLLSTLVPDQRWGIPHGAPRGARVFYKGGWRPTATGSLVTQAALVERGGRRAAVAVLTDGSPSHAYGVSTVRGIARRVLTRRRGGHREQAVPPRPGRTRPPPPASRRVTERSQPPARIESGAR